MPRMTKAFNTIKSTVDTASKYAKESEAFQTASAFSKGAMHRAKSSGAYGTFMSDMSTLKNYGRGLGRSYSNIGGGMRAGKYGAGTAGSMMTDKLGKAGKGIYDKMGNRAFGYAGAGAVGIGATADLLNPFGLGFGD